MTTTVSSGLWHIDLPPGATPAFPDGQYLVTADVSDAAGNPRRPEATAHDLGRPHAPTSQSAPSPATMSSMRRGRRRHHGLRHGRRREDGQVVTLALKSRMVSSRCRTLTVAAEGRSLEPRSAPGRDAGVPDGPYLVTADVSDAAGNPAPEATRTITATRQRASVTINTIAGNDVGQRGRGAGVITVSGNGAARRTGNSSRSR